MLRARILNVLRRRRAGAPDYRAWAARHAPNARELSRMREASARFACQPLVSLVTPVFNTDPRMLEACIESVRSQAYPRWELCLCDDASTSPGTRQVLSACAGDPRIKIVRLESNAHISGASNAALALATGDFVGLLDHDDELTPDAVFEMVALLNRSPEIDVIYSDEDKRDQDGGLSEPYFKPDWAPEHLLSAMYACHFLVIRRELIERVGGFRAGYEGSQDHDLMLRLSEETRSIRHLPKVLYHWRRTPGSTAASNTEKPWATEAGMRALEDAMRRRQVAATVHSGGLPGLYRVQFAIQDQPLVSIVALNSTSRSGDPVPKTTYPRTEVLHLDWSLAGSAHSLNEAAAHSRGAHLLFLDGSLIPMNDEWLQALLEFSQQPEIAAVAGKIHDADGRIRHAGLLLGVGPGVARAMHGEPAQTYGYFSGAMGLRNYSAVSGECLMTRRDVFDRLGGFDPTLPWSGADVDYCLKAAQAGLRVVYTPYAQLRLSGEGVHHNPEPDAGTTAVLVSRWKPWFDRDPHYNPNLSRQIPFGLREAADGSVD